ncbi:MAG: four helix bundle protein [Parcubacteria group bacterium CG11_big_fil_rev_8_21_14_0_20_39_22]|nr:MAG: four helix bundle protein [Parcubacteria group bacterium CG11_big_fil_rev_8_21_14_0_20_39_22]
MSKDRNSNSRYDLEERTKEFALKMQRIYKKLPGSVQNIEDGKQLIRSSGSQAANYIEANEALSKKDFAYRIKICRKEAKETTLWLELCNTGDSTKLNEMRDELLNEVVELRKIFSSILSKSLEN